MFTGLIEEVGVVAKTEWRGSAMGIHIRAPRIARDLMPGESVAVDGACLTVERRDDTGFSAYASEETLLRTTLGDASPGRKVNLERALQLGDRLGGHFVSGHVDDTGRVVSLHPQSEGWWLQVSASTVVMGLCVPKGSIAVDGISLTVVEVDDGWFSVAVIPETYRNTTLCQRRAGDRLNLETDQIGKYVMKAVGALVPGASAEAAKNQRMLDLLKDSGFIA